MLDALVVASSVGVLQHTHTCTQLFNSPFAETVVWDQSLIYAKHLKPYFRSIAPSHWQTQKKLKFFSVQSVAVIIPP